ncbi:MAG TPA: hypothetical protein VFR58_03770 [Flavisolibacter sp.]|nr:hypothetical protein [Flavisolibacter sp.]
MTKIKTWQWSVLATSFFQLMGPGVLTLLGFSVSAENSSPQITPAGYTFAVWGVITLLSFAYGIYQCLPDRINWRVHWAMSRGLSLVYLLFLIWLVAAVMKWLAATVLVFITMFCLLTLLFQKLMQERKKLNLTERIILFGQVAIYTGWTTVAVFANAASAIKYYGVSDAGLAGIIWQAAILILALINGKYWLNRFDRDLIFGTTIIWALAGVYFGLLQYPDNGVLRVITLAGMVLVAGHLVMKGYARDQLKKSR